MTLTVFHELPWLFYQKIFSPNYSLFSRWVSGPPNHWYCCVFVVVYLRVGLVVRRWWCPRRWAGRAASSYCCPHWPHYSECSADSRCCYSYCLYCPPEKRKYTRSTKEVIIPMRFRPFSRTLTGRNKAPFPMPNYSFFSQFKGFFPNFICSALNIAPENKICIIKWKVVYMTVKKVTLLLSFSNSLPNNFHNFRLFARIFPTE